MSSEPAVWFPTVRTGTGTDIYTERLVSGLCRNGLRAEITWLPLRAEFAPWTVSIPKPPKWATIVHVSTWLHTRFLPAKLPTVATIHHAVHHPDVKIYKGAARALYHRSWIAPNERSVLRQSARVVAVSQFAANSARENLLNVPCKVIYNGIDTTTFCPPNTPRQTSKPFRLLYVGSWKTLKGVALLPEIMSELGTEFELQYTGGPIAKKFNSTMPANMLDIGHLPGSTFVAKAMQYADALLFPSRSEGFGLVAAEAMACGLPVIAAKSAALEEIVTDGLTGMLCTPDDASDFASSARLLSTNPELHRRLSQAARISVIERFSEKVMIELYKKLYQELLTKI